MADSHSGNEVTWMSAVESKAQNVRQERIQGRSPCEHLIVMQAPKY
jgi:hypothetical protein